MAAAGFLSDYPSGLLPYCQCHVILNKNVLSGLLKKAYFPFYPSYPVKVKTRLPWA